MVLPVQCIDAAEDDDRRHGEGGVAAGGILLPVRAEEGIDECETADEQQRIQEEE